MKNFRALYTILSPPVEVICVHLILCDAVRTSELVTIANDVEPEQHKRED
jgi:hypothetical protein